MEKIRLIVVESFQEDIAATARLLSVDPLFEVVATATEALSLAELLRAHRPDLTLLDLAMLRRGSKRLPVAQLVKEGLRLVLLTDPVDSATMTSKKEATLALIEGALDVVFRPHAGKSESLEPERRAFRAHLLALAASTRRSPGLAAIASAPLPRGERVEVVGVVASTGGPTALAELLREPIGAPVLVALHMPVGFARGFARTLHAITHREVRLAEDGALAEAGTVYLPPDGMDLGISPSLKLRVGVRGPHTTHPSGNVVFEDLAAFGSGAVGVVLTGMGDDGLAGARKLRAAGGRILVQDRASCVVFGMPGAVAAEGLADQVLAPKEIARQIRLWIS